MRQTFGDRAISLGQSRPDEQFHSQFPDSAAVLLQPLAATVVSQLRSFFDT
jgi:hypothetical protein